MEENCFTVWYWLLSYINMNQPQVYTCPLPPEPPSQVLPHPTPLGCQGALGCAPCVTQKISPGYRFYTRWCICFISHASQVMLKNLQARLQQYLKWTMNFQMFKLVLEKAKEPEIKLPPSTGSLKKQESSRKTSTSALLTMPKPLIVWISTNCGKFWKRWEYQITWPASWETCMEVRMQQLELDMEQQTGSK